MKVVRGVLSTAVLLLVVSNSGQVKAAGVLQKRAQDTGNGGSHGIGSDEGSHSLQDDTHDHEMATDCAVSGSLLSHEFSELSVEMMLSGADGLVCSAEVEGHEDEGEGHEGHEEGTENDTRSDLLDPLCDSYFQFGKRLLLRLNLTTPCCLGNETSCHGDEEEPTMESTRTPIGKAYGYGFLMVMLVSLASLLGVLLLPIARNPRLKKYYDYVYALLISLGASALFCDAVLHLIPEALGLHDHTPASTGHAHSQDQRQEELKVVWQTCVVILGMYAFFMFEFVLHSLTSHSHSHSHSHSIPLSHSEHAHMKVPGSPTSENHELHDFKQEEGLVVAKATAKGENGLVHNNAMVDATFPHGTCHSHSDGMVDATFPHGTCHSHSDGIGSSILHPRTEECGKKGCQKNKVKSYGRKFGSCIRNIKPLAWLILVGDGLHNFTDGLALGAAISQSLSLGISTTIALVFHEIPHELGDFFVLLSTGMSWYTAVCFNFVSALTAIVGFFVGVAVGTSSADANNWILALAAGVFLYIALVDLLPELIHSKEKGGCKRMVLFLMINLGFIISFTALLLLAIYEEELNSLITV